MNISLAISIRGIKEDGVIVFDWREWVEWGVTYTLVNTVNILGIFTNP